MKEPAGLKKKKTNLTNSRERQQKLIEFMTPKTKGKKFFNFQSSNQANGEIG